jgi:hypothetical protein
MRSNKLLYPLILILGLLFTDSCCAIPVGDQQNNGEDEIEWVSSDKVIIQGRDNYTGRVFSAEVKIGQRVMFGELSLYVKQAWHSAPEESEESVAYVEIYETKIGESRRSIFCGWFVASVPAISPFDHPCYDLWLKETIVPKEMPPAPKELDAKKAQKAEENEEELND